jgi:hypothetical protein
MPRKETSPRVSAIASRVMRDVQTATEDDIKALAASALGQDETQGQKPMTEEEARALFKDESVEINTLNSNRDGSAKRRSMAATWTKNGETLRQSIMIPDGPHGLSAAAHTLRGHIDAINEGKAK